ncbi:hypothetical protein ACLB2K_048156 [Fragaria x ananassa]
MRNREVSKQRYREGNPEPKANSALLLSCYGRHVSEADENIEDTYCCGRHACEAGINIEAAVAVLQLSANQGQYHLLSPLNSNLQTVDLSNNLLQGSIPTPLSPELNGLTGALPPQLGNLTKLQVLKLQSNNLAGGIPTEFTGLTSLSVLNISWNALNGSIPSTVSNLQKLINMNIQRNNLSGSIPNTILPPTW